MANKFVHLTLLVSRFLNGSQAIWRSSQCPEELSRTWTSAGAASGGEARREGGALGGAVDRAEPNGGSESDPQGLQPRASCLKTGGCVQGTACPAAALRGAMSHPLEVTCALVVEQKGAESRGGGPFRAVLGPELYEAVLSVSSCDGLPPSYVLVGEPLARRESPHHCGKHPRGARSLNIDLTPDRIPSGDAAGEVWAIGAPGTPLGPPGVLVANLNQPVAAVLATRLSAPPAAQGVEAEASDAVILVGQAGRAVILAAEPQLQEAQVSARGRAPVLAMRDWRLQQGITSAVACGSRLIYAASGCLYSAEMVADPQPRGGEGAARRSPSSGAQEKSD